MCLGQIRIESIKLIEFLVGSQILILGPADPLTQAVDPLIYIKLSLLIYAIYNTQVISLNMLQQRWL